MTDSRDYLEIGEIGSEIGRNPDGTPNADCEEEVMGWWIVLSVGLGIFAIVSAGLFRRKVVAMAVAIDAANATRDRELIQLREQTTMMANALIRKQVIDPAEWYLPARIPASESLASDPVSD
jgi:hypothetical protein